MGSAKGLRRRRRVKALIGLAWVFTWISQTSVALAKSAIIFFPRDHAPTGELTVLEPLPEVHIKLGRALDLEGTAVWPVRPVVAHVASRSAFASSTADPIRRLLAGQTGGSPLAYATMTSGFGMRWHPLLGGERMHSGVDLAAPAGSPIAATADGIVSQAGWNGGYGLYVAISHPGGLQTRYGHMSQITVGAGQAVSKGELIGYVGSTGRSTGPHLHYEVRRNGLAVRPVAR